MQVLFTCHAQALCRHYTSLPNLHMQRRNIYIQHSVTPPRFKAHEPLICLYLYFFLTEEGGSITEQIY